MITGSSTENAGIDRTASRFQIGPQAWLLRGLLLETSTEAAEIADQVVAITSRAPFRQMVTPGGRRMSVALTNCGELGWTSDRRGYRYTSHDPDSGDPWPPMPASFLRLATRCAIEAGFEGFEPDACLINRYEPGARLSLHRDQDERDFDAPIVSMSLGLGAVFLFGGHSRSDRPLRVLLEHGDVVVWGGVDRLRYHGVMPLKEATEAEATQALFDDTRHPLLLRHRINLTFRKAA
jgi:alkylated DNA repair protein (DNA oxidative demethylase)